MTDTARQPQHSVTDAFFTDLPLTTRAPIATLSRGTVIAANSRADGERHFCGGYQAPVYPAHVPLTWDD